MYAYKIKLGSWKEGGSSSGIDKELCLKLLGQGPIT